MRAANGIEHRTVARPKRDLVLPKKLQSEKSRRFPALWLRLASRRYFSFSLNRSVIRFSFPP